MTITVTTTVTGQVTADMIISYGSRPRSVRACRRTPVEAVGNN
jgi:hypothetical protein